jgi:DNA-binding transcriptional MerR regulator
MKLLSVGAVADRLSVSVQSLRRWEAEGLIPKPSRTLTDRRFYSESDLFEIQKFLEAKHPRQTEIV